MPDLDARARVILGENDRGGFTVPTSGLYPFQWNWDSCFVALGFAAFDEDRAWQEIETLLSSQWADGMVPSIIFHQDDPGYFPGPEIWATGRTPHSTGITQPPVAASCVRLLLEQARDRSAAEHRARALLPKLLASHRWFHEARDPSGSGLVTTIHPWETGMDNSPAWDEAMARMEVAPDLEPYERRDTGHVDASQRPHKSDYDRYMTLVELFRRHGYAHEIEALSPWRVADPCTNFLLLRADRDLAWLAEQFGEPTRQIQIWITRAEAALPRLLHPATGHPHALDLVTGELAPTPTSAGFLSLWAGLGDAATIERLEAWIAPTPYPVASVAIDDRRFESRRYWRGPTWAFANFMIADGLARSGRPDLASRIQTATRTLIERHGFFEYFDPLTGEGCGGDSFSWTAAMWLAWASRDRAGG